MVQGDEQAYRIFYDDYYDRLRRYLLVLTRGNEETTREALQSALIRVVKYARRFSKETEFWGWLTVLARSALVDLARKRKRYGSFLERFTRHSQIEHDSPAAAEPDQILLALLKEHLAALSPEERKLVEAKYLAGTSVHDLAQEWQSSEKAIESRLGRIRRKLKAELLQSLKNEARS